jgi:hypothetical protein
MASGSIVGLALAPAVAGALSLFLGVFTATRLTDTRVTVDEAALRLFAAFFFLFAFWFLTDAVRGLRTHPGGVRRPAGLAFSTLATLVLGAIAAPFNFAWTAPWTLFQSLVFAIDLVFALLLVRTIALLVRRLRGTRPRPPASLSTTRVRIRQRRLTFAAILFGSLGALPGWLGAQQASADWNLWSRLQPVDGLVMRQISFSFRGRDGRPAQNAAAVIHYMVDGKAHETIQRIDPAATRDFAKGARVQILYDPATPERGRLADAYETFLISGALLMTSVIFLGIGGMSAARAGAQRG